MTTISVQVPIDVAKAFVWQKVIKYQDLVNKLQNRQVTSRQNNLEITDDIFWSCIKEKNLNSLWSHSSNNAYEKLL